MKRVISIILTVLMIVSMLSTFAFAETVSGTCGTNVNWTLDTETGTLTISGTGTMTDYTSSSSVPWYSYRTSVKTVTIENGVTSIGDGAFSSCTSLTSITIPDSVTSIGDDAFCYCRSLTSITIPDGVTSIGDDAFYYCMSLTSITIPDSVTSISYYAFEDCTSLTSITIPDSVTYIGSYAFYGCSSLKDVYYNGSVADFVKIHIDYNNSYFQDAVKHFEKSVITGVAGTNVTYSFDSEGILTISGTGAMADYTSSSSVPWYSYRTSVKTVTIENGVTSIGRSAFYGCTSLTSITIPDSVTSIGDDAFCYCRSLTSITIPDGVTSIGDDAFYYCRSLTSITIPDGVITIGWCAFYGCVKLLSVTIPDSVTSIGDSAFYFCKSLTSITIPDSVTSIGSETFSGCTSLTLINVDELNEKYISVDSVIFNKDKTTLVCYPAGKIDTSYSIPEGVISIGSSAFSDCTALTSITIPDGVTSISEGTFYYCTSLTSITIPDSVTSIGKYAFYNCTSLTSITIPDGVTSIGHYAFEDCTSLETVYYCGATEDFAKISIGSGNEYLKSATKHYNIKYTVIFKGLDGSILSTAGAEEGGAVTAPEAPVVEKYDFTGWDKSLENITEDTVITAVYETTGNCGKSTIWKLNANTGTLTISGVGAMTNYSDAASVPWLTYIENIKNIIIEDGVTSIGDYAFTYCEFTESVEIPSSIISIGNRAFRYCDTLTDVYYNGTEKSYAKISIGDSNASFDDATKHFIIPKYTVTFKGFDGSVILIAEGVEEGSAVTAPKAPVVEGYDFTGWDKSLENITSDTEITAQYQIKVFTVSFFDVNGDLIKELTGVEYGTDVTAPEVSEIEGYDFTGWDKSLKNITEDTKITAQYQIKVFAVRFLYENGNLYKEYTVEYGNDVIAPEGPVKEGHTFIGWDSECTDVKENIVVSPLYEINEYTVVFKDKDGNVLSTIENVEYGSSVTAPKAPEIEGYTFTGWDKSSEIITENTVINAVYEITLIASGTCGNNLDWTLAELGTLTIIGTGAMTNYSSASSVPWLTYIGNIKNIKIEEGVTSIGNYAFTYCEFTESVEIPSSVTSIGNRAFRHCDLLTDVYYNASNTDYGKIIIGDNNDPLNNATKHYVEDIVTGTAGANATYSFDPNTAVLTITGSGTLWSPGLEAAKRPLVKEVVIEGLTSISANIFNGANFTSLEKVTLPDGITSLGAGAFTDCKTLKEINLPSSLTSIGNLAFYNCKALTKIDIPANVTSIGNSAFLGVVASDINFAGTRDSWDKVSVGTDNTRLSFVACSDDYRVILDKATKGDAAWIFNEGRETVYFAGSNVGYIKSYTEANPMIPADIAAKVKYIDIDETMAGFGAYLFANMTNLVEVTGGENIRYVGNYAFKGCTSLKTVEFTNAQYFGGISYGLFSDCTSLETIEISDSIAFFYGASFQRCTSLKSINVPARAGAVGEYAFRGCTALETITLEEGVTSFGAGAIQNCSSLKTINFPSTLNAVGAYAFYSVPSTITVNFNGTQAQWKTVYVKTGNATLNYLKVNYK